MNGSNPEAELRYAPFILWIAKAPCHMNKVPRINFGYFLCLLDKGGSAAETC